MSAQSLGPPIERDLWLGCPMTTAGRQVAPEDLPVVIVGLLESHGPKGKAELYKGQKYSHTK